MACVQLAGGPGEDDVDVCCVSERTQTQSNFGLEIGPQGQKNIHRFVCVVVFGRGFCPHRDVRMQTEWVAPVEAVVADYLRATPSIAPPPMDMDMSGLVIFLCLCIFIILT